MFKFSELRHIQVEITNRCQASCPMCLRNIHGGIDNPNLQLTDWTLDEFKLIFNQEVLDKIESINFCGDFGDPIINNDLLDMCDYVSASSNVSIIIHTNGSARNVQWWEKLAKTLPANHNVVIALDGLRDTHSLYRIGTDFDKIIENARAFIAAGGKAEWAFIKFKHNQHQIADAELLSKQLGFNKFTLKNSKRFSDKFPVLTRQGTVSHYIEQPTNSNLEPINFYSLKDYKSWNTTVDCFTLNEKELYIDANKRVLPCCIIGSFLYSNYDLELYKKYNVADDSSIIPIAAEAKSNVLEILEEFGGLEQLDALKYGIKEIMQNPLWEDLVKGKWPESNSAPCVLLCSQATPFMSVDEQYINREV